MKILDELNKGGSVEEHVRQSNPREPRRGCGPERARKQPGWNGQHILEWGGGDVGRAIPGSQVSQSLRDHCQETGMMLIYIFKKVLLEDRL